MHNKQLPQFFIDSINEELEYKAIIVSRSETNPYNVIRSYIWNHIDKKWLLESNPVRSEDIEGLDRVTRHSNRVMSNGEELMANTLRRAGILYNREYTIPELPNRRYDFYFIYNGNRCLIEIDGMQHFSYHSDFDNDISNFHARQEADRIKTKWALLHDYRLLRIDYDSLDRLGILFSLFLTSNDPLHLSEPNLYEYLYSEQTESNNTPSLMKVTRDKSS